MTEKAENTSLERQIELTMQKRKRQMDELKKKYMLLESQQESDKASLKKMKKPQPKKFRQRLDGSLEVKY